MISFGLQLRKESIRQWEKMLKVLVGKFVAKHGIVPLLLKVGGWAVKATKTKDDDKVWVKVKKVLEEL
jgi:hypothetical protein